MHTLLVVLFRQYPSHMFHGAARFMLAQPLRASAARGLLFQLLYLQHCLASSSCNACSAIGIPGMLTLLLF